MAFDHSDRRAPLEQIATSAQSDTSPQGGFPTHLVGGIALIDLSRRGSQIDQNGHSDL